MAKINWQKLDKFWLVCLLLVLAVGFFLRLAWLGEYGLHSQEALLGYRGKLLSNSLVDETNRKLPLIFTSFEGYQWFLPSYLVALSVKIFGLNEFAVHLPFALFGCLGLVAFFGVCRYFFPKNKWLAIWAVLVLALSPTLTFLSRTSSYVVLFLNLAFLGFWLFLFFKKRKAFKAISILFLVVFLLIILMLLGYWQTRGWQQDLLHKRFGFFTNPAIINSINRMRGENLRAGSPLLGKLFYNKTFYGVQLIKVFFDHLKPQFYFVAGDKSFRHGLSNFGSILAVFLPLFLVGVYCLFKDKKLKNLKWILIAWFLLGMIPSILKHPSPDQEKLVLVFPAFAILIGYVASRLRRYQLIIFSFLLVLNFGFVVYDFVYKEPIRAQADWQYGVKQLAKMVQNKQKGFDKIFITDKYSPDIGSQLLFYFDYPIDQLWQLTNLEKGKIVYRQWINQIDNIKIGQFDNWQISPGEKGLLVVTPEEKELLVNYRIIKRGANTSCFQINNQVIGLDGEPIYLLMEMTSENCLLEVEKEEE